MKRTFCVLSLAIILIAALMTPGAAALKLSFKLNGGASLLLNGAGDLEKFRLSEKAYAADWAEGDAYSSTFNWKKLSMAPEFGGEVILHFSPKLGVGLGVGSIRVGRKGEYALNYTDEWNAVGGTFNETLDTRTSYDFSGSAVPIMLNFHFQTALAPRLNFIGYAGVGYYLGKFTNDTTNTWSDVVDYTSSIYWDEKGTIDATLIQKSKATCNKIGFQAGMGLEMLLTPAISVGLELTGRMINFNDWKGDSEYNYSSRTRLWIENLGWYFDETKTSVNAESGDLWTWDWRWGYNDKDYTTMGISKDKPSGSTIKNVRNSAINLNRIGALFTIRYHFDI